MVCMGVTRLGKKINFSRQQVICMKMLANLPDEFYLICDSLMVLGNKGYTRAYAIPDKTIFPIVLLDSILT
jgi:hypothetical protein